MNIFKILANGDGSINEPNISAFLSFLLNPKFEHGLNDELLKKFISLLFKDDIDSNPYKLFFKNGEIKNLSRESSFDFEVLLEQTFIKNYKNKSKKTVDIVVLCYKKTKLIKEGHAEMLIENKSKRELKHIILIENKIRDRANSKNNSNEETNQLINQYESTKNALSRILNKDIEVIAKMISVIFVCPNANLSNNHYRVFEKKYPQINSLKLYWGINKKNKDKRNDEEIIKISSLLREILEDEIQANIEPLTEYSKHTLKSFIRFIENNFESLLDEKSDVNRDIIYNYPDFYEKYKSILSLESWELLSEFIDINLPLFKRYNLKYRHSKTHCITILNSDNDKFFALSKYGNRLKIQFVLKGKNHNYKNSIRAGIEKHIFNKVVKEKDGKVINVLPVRNKEFNIKEVNKVFKMLLELIYK